MTKMVWSQGGHIERRLLYHRLCNLLTVFYIVSRDVLEVSVSSYFVYKAARFFTI